MKSKPALNYVVLEGFLAKGLQYTFNNKETTLELTLRVNEKQSKTRV